MVFGADILRIGLYFKKDNKTACNIAKRIIDLLKKNYDTKIFVEKELSDLIKEISTYDVKKASEYVDVIMAIGGDGTVIKVFHEMKDHDVPVMTVRTGHRGVLLDVSPLELEDRIKDLLEKKFVLREYERIYAYSDRFKTLPALNDIILTPSTEFVRMKIIRFSVYKNDRIIYSLEGDGVIISTPVGSTAYSLAIGGPVIDRRLRAMVITPFASIQLWARPVVLSSDETIKIVLRKDSNPAELIIDGSLRYSVEPGEEIFIKKYHRPARIIRFHDEDEIYERVFERR
jgi:NAD+ kinase